MEKPQEAQIEQPNTKKIEFFKLVHAGEAKKVAEILEQKLVDVNEVEEANENRTALHIAALYGENEFIRMLVEDYGADIDIIDKQKMAPIHVAAASYHLEIVKFFIEKNSIYKDDVSELLNEKIVDEFFNAVDANDTERVVELIKAGVNVNVMDLTNYRRTAVHVAASNGHEHLVRLLVDEYKADISIEDEIGELPLHNAIDNGHLDIVKYLVEKQN